MTIRSRLLILLLPSLLVFVAAISFFLYLHWYNEILSTYQAGLRTAVTSCAQIIDPDDHRWIEKNRDDPNLVNSRLYTHYHNVLHRIKQHLPISNLYTVRIKPVQIGEPVILDKPISSNNPTYDGTDSSLAYRRIYVLDASEVPPFSAGRDHAPGDLDFSISGEHSIYYTKEFMVTPIYKSKSSGREVMTGYAPILDRSKHVTGLVAADIAIDLIKPDLERALTVVISSALFMILLVICVVFVITQRISKPVKTLTNAALSIGAGHYGNAIEVDGPKELVELANTLNIMSSCMEEHVAHVEASCRQRERLYSSVACARMLQHHMLAKVVGAWKHPNLNLRHIHIESAGTPQGLLLSIDQSHPHSIALSLTEAIAPGFDAIYSLASSNGTDAGPTAMLTLTEESDGRYSINHKEYLMPLPLHWSSKENNLKELRTQHKTRLSNDDIILLYNTGLAERLQTNDTDENEVATWFEKILLHFAEDGLDTCTEMLEKELDTLSRKGEGNKDLHILIAKINES